MAKLPNHCFQKQIHVGHPSSVLRSAVKWLEIEATLYRKERNSDGAWAMRAAANAFRKIADGMTPAEAFDWAPQEPKVKQ